MKTTGVLPEVFAASISWFSRSEIDTIGELLSVAVISIDPTLGRQGSPSEWSRPELNPAPRHERSASVGAGVEIRASKRGSAPTGCGWTRRAPWGVLKILIPTQPQRPLPPWGRDLLEDMNVMVRVSSRTMQDC